MTGADAWAGGVPGGPGPLAGPAPSTARQWVRHAEQLHAAGLARLTVASPSSTCLASACFAAAVSAATIAAAAEVTGIGDGPA